ncbi:MAG: GNAT family N-acetyltransferase [Lachnospiraceae bacterium]|nr:GNAT family N-acetyltransferase [Lachnospiraceae bacterium]
MDLAWRTFVKYEAPEYTQEGIQNFKDFVTDGVLKTMFENGVYKLFVAVYEKKIIGIISLRDNNHISLLFVESKYHRQGVGSGLMQFLVEHMINVMNLRSLTVNAAPYGVEFYHKLGFEDTGPEQVNSGITYTPMVLNF